MNSGICGSSSSIGFSFTTPKPLVRLKIRPIILPTQSRRCGCLSIHRLSLTGGTEGSFVCIPKSFRQTSGFFWSLHQKADEEWGNGHLLVKLVSLWPQVVQGSRSSTEHKDSQRQPDSKFWRVNKWSQHHVPLKNFRASSRGILVLEVKQMCFTRSPVRIPPSLITPCDFWQDGDSSASDELRWERTYIQQIFHVIL